MQEGPDGLGKASIWLYRFVRAESSRLREESSRFGNETRWLREEARWVRAVKNHRNVKTKRGTITFGAGARE